MPDSVTITPGAEVIVSARWQVGPTWQEPNGLVEILAEGPIVVGHTLVKADKPRVAVRVMNTSTEPWNMGDVKVVRCSSMTHIRGGGPQHPAEPVRDGLSIVKEKLAKPICEMIKRHGSESLAG